MMKRVALIGSSGGGTATLGHTCPVSFLRTIDEQLSLIQGLGTDAAARLVVALFVALDGGRGMDGVDEQSSKARLFQFRLINDTEIRSEVVAVGSLDTVNRKCAELQRHLVAAKIRENHVDALICVSCHIGIFGETLQAAATRGTRFYLTGSGGTSLAQIGSIFSIKLTGNAGGSVATTTITKAVSYTHALARAWGMPYEPWKSHYSVKSNNPSLTSVLNSCLPAFWGVCLTKKFLIALERAVEDGGSADVTKVRFSSLAETVVSLEQHTLPTVCAVLTAISFRREKALSSVVSTVMAAIVASSSCMGTILTAMWAGYLVSLWSDKLLYTCIFWNFPATMTSLTVGGGLGGAISLLVLPLATILRNCTALFRQVLSTGLQSKPWGIGLAFVLGCLSCHGSKIGWYHSFHLPLILIEMETGDASFLGAIDELTLVLVCAGICAAIQFEGTRKKMESSPAGVLLCRRGLGVNLACGDFIEVCYPYMDASGLVNIGGYLASGLACSWLIWRNGQRGEGVLPQSSAYLPWPAAVALSSPCHEAMLEASFVAFGLSFLFALISPYKRKAYIK